MNLLIKFFLILIIFVSFLSLFPKLISAQTTKVNIPYFGSSNIGYNQTAISWFGKVTPADNYADIRLGYNDQILYINTAIIDQSLWYDTSSNSDSLNQFDAISLYLYTPQKIYKFIGQLNWWEERTNYQKAYTEENENWIESPINFTTRTGWRGDSPLNIGGDRGWNIVFEIPFTSLNQIPYNNWKMALTLHDKDDSTILNPDKYWPKGVNISLTNTWASLNFGSAQLLRNVTTPVQTLDIRNNVNGASVIDAHVGGHANCGGRLDYFTTWGEANYIGFDQINIQNQGDIADFPCFSKFYITFPLDSLPVNKVISSAELLLYQFGSAGEGITPDNRVPSFIQVLTVKDVWNESTINWNNAPQPIENITGTFIDPLAGFPGFPGIERKWNASYAVNEAYISGKPLDLVMYSSDWEYHSGRYFSSSDTQDWNKNARPLLRVTYADYLKGDLNFNGILDLPDILELINFIFKEDKNDVNIIYYNLNNDQSVDLSDIIDLIELIFTP